METKGIPTLHSSQCRNEIAKPKLAMTEDAYEEIVPSGAFHKLLAKCVAYDTSHRVPDSRVLCPSPISYNVLTPNQILVEFQTIRSRRILPEQTAWLFRKLRQLEFKFFDYEVTFEAFANSFRLVHEDVPSADDPDDIDSEISGGDEDDGDDDDDDDRGHSPDGRNQQKRKSANDDDEGLTTKDRQ